jgi:hypothetical protein
MSLDEQIFLPRLGLCGKAWWVSVHDSVFGVASCLFFNGYEEEEAA